MRASRAAKETSKYFDASPTTAALPRRSTRASIARFAHSGANGSADNGEPEVKLGSDIEDAVKTTAPRKRKRTETVTQPTPRRAATRTRTNAEIKTESKTEIKTETKTELDADDVEDTKPDTKPRPRGRVRKPARKTTDAAGTTTIEPPSDWEEIYNLVKEMRLTGPAANAAVDTMGCERLARPDASARDRRFQTLVSLMLSSQTKDTVNAEAMARLHTELPPHAPGAPPGLNLENMLAVDPTLLNFVFGIVGFQNNISILLPPPHLHHHPMI
jgi:endonuclease-3